MSKIINGKVAIPIEDYLVKSTARTRRINSEKFQVFTTKTQVYKNSFFPRTVPEWDTTPDEAVSSNDKRCRGR